MVKFRRYEIDLKWVWLVEHCYGHAKIVREEGTSLGDVGVGHQRSDPWLC